MAGVSDETAAPVDAVFLDRGGHRRSALSIDPAKLRRVLWTPPAESPRLKNIFWLHAPKTGSSFSWVISICTPLSAPDVDLRS